jgi:5-(carboxyamino)imidazole ribonucleotide mutase
VACVAIGGGKNAGLLAVQILGASDSKLRAKVHKYKAGLAAESRTKTRKLTLTTKTN